MGKMKTVCAAACLVTALGTAATAGDYWGFAIEGMDAESTAEFGGSSSATVPGLSVIVGRTYDRGAFYWGVEGSATATFDTEFEQSGFSCSEGANGPYMCKQKANLRIVGVLGKEFGAYGIYGKLGYGAAFGDFAIGTSEQDSGVIRGVTAAFGASRAMNNSTSLFGEVIYDNYTDDKDQPSGYKSEYEAWGLRVGFTKSF